MAVSDSTAKEMSSGVWSNLPEPVLEKVLAWLPLVVLARFRKVCRSWNHLFCSPRFIRTLRHQRGITPWLFVVAQLADPSASTAGSTRALAPRFRPRRNRRMLPIASTDDRRNSFATDDPRIAFAAFDFYSHRWYTLPAPQKAFACTFPSLMLSSAGKLLLDFPPFHRDGLHIYNPCPLIEQHIEKRLPPFSFIQSVPVAAGFCHHIDDGDQVVAIGRGPGYVCAVEYFRNNNWKVAGGLPSDISPTSMNMVEYKGSFLCLLNRPPDTVLQLHGLFGAVGDRFKWDVLLVPTPPNLDGDLGDPDPWLDDAWLVTCWQSLFLVGSVCKHLYGRVHGSILIWKFIEYDEIPWQLLTSMPRSMHEELYGDIPWVQPVSIGCRDLIVLFYYTRTVVIYNLSKDLWTYLPTCPHTSYLINV